MLPLQIGASKRHLRVLCVGAHSDDIEIGCGATLLRWIMEYERVDVSCGVLCGSAGRGIEAERSAAAWLAGAATRHVVLGDFEDGYLPADFRRAKQFLHDLRRRHEADVVLTHRLDDRHQDHRLIAELAWQVWRDHLLLEYEIPKFEGDLGQPNLYVPVSRELADRKVAHLLGHFGSQRSKSWFTAETFIGLMRLRGIESGSSTGWAEAFTVRKSVV